MAVLDGGSVDQPAIKNAHSLQHHERDNSGRVNGFVEPEVVGKINLLWAGQRWINEWINSLSTYRKKILSCDLW